MIQHDPWMNSFLSLSILLWLSSGILMFSDPDSELALVSLFAALICLNLAAWRLLTHD